MGEEARCCMAVICFFLHEFIHHFSFILCSLLIL